MLRSTEGMNRRDFLKVAGIGVATFLGVKPEFAAAAPVPPSVPTPHTEGAVPFSSTQTIKPSEEARAQNTYGDKRADVSIKEYVAKGNTVVCNNMRVNTVKEAAVHCTTATSPVPNKK